MIDVLVFVYENYWRGDACPESQQLGRKLTAVGFEADEIAEALTWLDGLQLATRHAAAGTAPESGQVCGSGVEQSADSLRVYSIAEQDHLGAECLGFVRFLESAGVMPPAMREIVVDRAMAAHGGPLDLDDLKVIVLMVYWSLGTEPDALVLDELCDDAAGRTAH